MWPRIQGQGYQGRRAVGLYARGVASAVRSGTGGPLSRQPRIVGFDLFWIKSNESSLGEPQRTLQSRPTEELVWTSKIRILNGGFWRTNRSYRFSLPIWQKRNQNFWTGYSKYSRNTTHWALTSRTIPIRQHTQSSL